MANYKTTIRKKLKTSKSYQESRNIVQEAVRYGGGKHSQILSKETVRRDTLDSRYPEYRRLNEDILLITIPSISKLDKRSISHYSGKLQNILMEKSYKGLILDLSNNTGGNMIPMIGGEPLFYQMIPYFIILISMEIRKQSR